MHSEREEGIMMPISYIERSKSATIGDSQY